MFALTTIQIWRGKRWIVPEGDSLLWTAKSRFRLSFPFPPTRITFKNIHTIFIVSGRERFWELSPVECDTAVEGQKPHFSMEFSVGQAWTSRTRLLETMTRSRCSAAPDDVEAAGQR